MYFWEISFVTKCHFISSPCGVKCIIFTQICSGSISKKLDEKKQISLPYNTLINALNFHHRLVLEACMHTFLCTWKKSFVPFIKVMKADFISFLISRVKNDERCHSLVDYSPSSDISYSSAEALHKKLVLPSQHQLTGNSVLLAPSFLWLYVAFWGWCSADLSNPLHIRPLFLSVSL